MEAPAGFEPTFEEHALQSEIGNARKNIAAIAGLSRSEQDRKELLTAQLMEERRRTTVEVDRVIQLTDEINGIQEGIREFNRHVGIQEQRIRANNGHIAYLRWLEARRNGDH